MSILMTPSRVNFGAQEDPEPVHRGESNWRGESAILGKVEQVLFVVLFVRSELLHYYFHFHFHFSQGASTTLYPNTPLILIPTIPQCHSFETL